MGNQYYSFSLENLRKACEAEFRFYRNSLRNFRPGNVADIGEYLVEAANTPKQASAMGYPTICIEGATQHFDFPAGMDDFMEAEGAFALEYLGLPADRDPTLTNSTYLALVGESAAADPYVGLRIDRRVIMDFGTTQTSAQVNWWWPDAPLHMIVSRAAGADPDTEIYINGCTVNFASNKAGSGGFTDAAGQIFNHTDNNAVNHPFWGHHLMLRLYDENLKVQDAKWLFQEAQRFLHEVEFPIPLYQSA
jgi:hypothetical protein